MPERLDNYDPKSIIHKGAKLQQPVDAIRDILKRLAAVEGREYEFFPQERFIGLIVGHGPPRSSSDNPLLPGTPANIAAGKFDPDYTDARYWLIRQQISGDSPTAPADFIANQTDVSLGIADSLYVTATNAAEVLNGNTHSLPTSGVMAVEVFAYWDSGSPQNKRYIFSSLPVVAWIKITSPMPPASLGSSSGGGGYYNARLLSGRPQTIDPTTDLTIPFDPNETIPSTDNILAENCLEANLGDPPSHWVPIPSFVPAWYVGMSDETPPRPVYRFAYQNPGVSVTVKVTGIEGSLGSPAGGKYKCRVLTGRSAGVDPTTTLSLPDTGETVPGSDDAILENDCENLIPNSNWIPIGSFVEARFAGYDNANPALPVYRAYIPSPPAPIKLTGTDADAQYTAEVLTLPSTASSGTAFTAPGGMGVPGSNNALACNLDESGLTGHRLATPSFALGSIVGATSDGTMIVYFHGGVGSTVGPKALNSGTFGAPDATTWNRDTDGVGYTLTEITAYGVDASGVVWWHTRDKVVDARGMDYSVSAETEYTSTGTSCP